MRTDARASGPSCTFPSTSGTRACRRADAAAGGTAGGYYANPDAAFDLPLAPAGSDFQQRVWQAISAVPRGAVTTYGTIAEAIGAMPRAVGQACGQNPFPIVIPCHRVVSARGIGGFSHHAEDGFYLDVKRWLLRHEGAMLL